MLSRDEFNRAFTSNGYTAPRRDHYDAFINGLCHGNIKSPLEACMFLAQIIHESGGLQHMEETGRPRTYNHNGRSYYGRSPIQLTHHYNYKDASQDLYGNNRLLDNPDLVSDNEDIAWATALWYWRKYVHNAPGVQQGHFGATTCAINHAMECRGPYKQKARIRFDKYKKVLSAGLNPRVLSIDYYVIIFMI